VQIPASVIHLDGSAFSDCQSLTAIEVDPQNPEFTSMDGVVFNKDKTVLLAYPAGKPSGRYDMPASVTTISAVAFDQCKNLRSVPISKDITQIGEGAFVGTNLPALVVEDQNPAYKTVDGVLFTKDGSTLLVYPPGRAGSYAIPSGVTKIGNRAFEGCAHLTSVTLPESVTVIGARAFYNCEGLTGIVIPRGVTKIEANAFDECWNLTKADFLGAAPKTGDGAFNSVTPGFTVTYSAGAAGFSAPKWKDSSGREYNAAPITRPGQ